MDMSEVECMNMVEEQNHPTNHQVGEEDMNMVEEHYHLTNHRPEVEDMDMVEEHYHPINHRSAVVGMDREDSGMRKDMTVEVEVVEREHEGVVLMRHWAGDEAEMHGRACRE
jgi:hypothetical protein